MTFSVWTIDQIDDTKCVLADIPSRDLAEKLQNRIFELYRDDRTWIEED